MDKQLERLAGKPKDFTFEELHALLEHLGFIMSNKGKTCGARVKFMKENIPILLHRPHPKNILSEYQVKYVVGVLKENGII